MSHWHRLYVLIKFFRLLFHLLILMLAYFSMFASLIKKMFTKSKFELQCKLFEYHLHFEQIKFNIQLRRLVCEIKSTILCKHIKQLSNVIQQTILIWNRWNCMFFSFSSFYCCGWQMFCAILFYLFCAIVCVWCDFDQQKFHFSLHWHTSNKKMPTSIPINNWYSVFVTTAFTHHTTKCQRVSCSIFFLVVKFGINCVWALYLSIWNLNSKNWINSKLECFFLI